MKPAKRNSARKVALKSLMRKRSLIAVKRCAVQKSASALPKHAAEGGSFGMIPRDAEVEVVKWPAL